MIDLPRVAACRLCGWWDLRTVLDLGTLASCGVFPKPNETVPEGPLELVACEGCGLAQLAHVYPLRDLYGEHYGYRSGLNQTMVEHLKDVAAEAWRLAQPSPGETVVDIGANDGTLLASYPTTVQRWAFDPLTDKFRSHYPPDVFRVAGFFGPDVPFHNVAIVTSIACFYDLPDPVGTALAIARMLRPGGVWSVEVADLHQMVDNLAFDQIVHEHLEYYRADDLIEIGYRVGLACVGITRNPTNGGSVRLLFQKGGEDCAWKAGQHVDWARFATEIGLATKALRVFLERCQKEKRTVWGYGASTKGNVLLQLAAVTSKLLPVIVDANPAKDGCLTPGTGIPIQYTARTLSEIADAPTTVLVFPWHFRDYVIQKERQFLEDGGRLVFPLPQLDIVTCESLAKETA